MEPLLRKEFDATSVKPDGYIEVVYFGEESNTSYFFDDVKSWHWEVGEQGPRLIVVFNTGDRHEIPTEHIRTVKVKGNSPGYILAQEYLEAVDEVEVLEAKLRWKQGVVARKREEMLRWHGTSSSK